MTGLGERTCVVQTSRQLASKECDNRVPRMEQDRMDTSDLKRAPQDFYIGYCRSKEWTLGSTRKSTIRCKHWAVHWPPSPRWYTGFKLVYQTALVGRFFLLQVTLSDAKSKIWERWRSKRTHSSVFLIAYIVEINPLTQELCSTHGWRTLSYASILSCAVKNVQRKQRAAIAGNSIRLLLSAHCTTQSEISKKLWLSKHTYIKSLERTMPKETRCKRIKSKMTP